MKFYRRRSIYETYYPLRYIFYNDEIEEYIEKVGISGGLQLKQVADSVTFKIDELVQRSYSDVVIGRTALAAFAMPVDVSGSNTPTV